MWHWSIRLYDRQHQIENKQTYPTTINVTPKQGSPSFGLLGRFYRHQNFYFRARNRVLR